MITVYFVPFQLETYLPITPLTIKCQAKEKWLLTDQSQIDRLLELFGKGNTANFDDRRVRVLISSDNFNIFVDSNGVALMDGKSIKVDKYEFENFAKSLDSNQRQFLHNLQNCQ